MAPVYSSRVSLLGIHVFLVFIIVPLISFDLFIVAFIIGAKFVMAGDEGTEIYEEREDSMDVSNEAELEKEEGGDSLKVLQFLDSLDEYLTLMDSLSSKLREGWFDLASARHSMGTLRINSTLLDLKFHPAASTLQVTEKDVESLGSVPRFALSKWASKGGSGKGKDFSTDAVTEMGSPRSPQLRHRGVSEEKPSAKGETVLAADEEIKRERAKSLSVFGGLVSPKLRGAQLSFETALETLVEIANTRSSMLTAFEHITKRSNDCPSNLLNGFSGEAE